jgi:hypothetical protein
LDYNNEQRFESQTCRDQRQSTNPNNRMPHNPPHFHVEFQGEKATFTFDGQLLAGRITSGTVPKLVRDRARRRRLELMINWKNVEKGRRLNRIAPLE